MKILCACECVWFRSPDFCPFQNEAKSDSKTRHAFHPLFAGFKCVSECFKEGAGEGNRTLTTSLEGWSSTIELHPLLQHYSLLTDRKTCAMSAARAGSGYVPGGTSAFDLFFKSPRH